MWAWIEALAGEPFRQKQGQAFTYELVGAALVPSTTRRLLSRRNFARAFRPLPLTGLGQVQHLQGPSYVYAIRMDERVRQGDW